MNLKKNLSKLIIVSLSIVMGIIASEKIGRSLGLGNPLLYTKDYLVGYRLKNNQIKKRLKSSMVNTDYEGFRFDPKKVNNSSAKITLFAGDSVTYGGSYIDNSDLFSTLYCEKDLNMICLNSGVNGWGTDNMGRFISNLPLYTERSIHKIILIILPGVDDLRNLTSIQSVPYWTSDPKYPNAINEMVNYLLLKYILPSLRRKEVIDNKDYSKKLMIKNRTKDIAWKNLNGHIESSGIKVDVLLTPPKKWFENYKVHESEIKAYEKRLLILSKNPNVKVTCNLFNSIKNDYSSDYYTDTAHLSVLGHQTWSKHIKLCLNKP